MNEYCLSQAHHLPDDENDTNDRRAETLKLFTSEQETEHLL